MSAVQFSADSAQVYQPCACGGYVRANPAYPAPSLLKHYRSNRHRFTVWGMLAAENDAVTFTDPVQAHPERPTAGTTSRDVSEHSPRASAAPGGEPAA